MLCSFVGGFADGCLVEFALEQYWVDGTPPAVLWVTPDADVKSKLPMSGASLSPHGNREQYILVRVDKVEEYANMVYTYQHSKLDTDFMARTRQGEIEA